MIVGIGTDLVDNNRIKLLYEKYENNFLEKVFTENEIEYSFSKNNPHIHLAARWTAKEAFWKSLNFNKMFRPLWLEIRSEKIIPRINVVSDQLVEILNSKKIFNIHLSISHEKDYSLSFVILEGGNIK